MGAGQLLRGEEGPGLGGALGNCKEGHIATAVL